MYGVVFVVENVKMKKIKFTEEKDINSQEANKFEEYKEGLTLIKEESEQKEDFEQLNQPCSIQEMISIQNENLSTIKIDEEFKEKSSLKDTHVSHKDKTTTISKVTDTADGETVSSKQYHQYGPFLGQIIGTVKECSRLSYLQGEPRLYEALYLCTFQLNIENIGKIHSVINKRRGRVNMLNLDYR